MAALNEEQDIQKEVSNGLGTNVQLLSVSLQSIRLLFLPIGGSSNQGLNLGMACSIERTLFDRTLIAKFKQ